MDVNVLVRGQSNAVLMMTDNGAAGAAALQAEVSRLLGFSGGADRVNLVFDSQDWNSGTAFGGTALIGDWLTPRNNDWRQGWTVAGREQALLNEIASLPAARQDDPTAIVFLHSEYDSANTTLTTEQWLSALRFDAGLTRAALGGQGPGTTPYLFVSAMPYYGTTDGHNAIRRGMEALAAEPGFNAAIAARMLDIDADGDNPGWHGGGHIDAADGMQTAMRIARSVAESLAPYATPGSPVASAGGDIANLGPRVVAATMVGQNQLRIDVAHDRAGGFQPLDPDAARGVGWSVVADGGTVTGAAAVIEDADTILVTFSGPLPVGGLLHYGFGYGRLAGVDGSGRGNAVYDDQGLPIWVPAVGLAPGGVSGAIGTPPAPPAPVIGFLVDGGPGVDNLRGGAGNDTLNGQDGSDDLQGAGGDDRLAGGRGHDGLTLGAGADTIVFARGDGNDWIVDFAPGNDRLEIDGYAASQATIRTATYWGMAGTDILLANGDSLFLQGVTDFRASDVTWSGGGATLLPPAPAAGLQVEGGPGVDNLRGGAGNDTLNGQDGSDDLQSFDGDDRLAGGRGHDGLTLGAGADTIVFARGDGNDWVVDFAPGTDRLEINGYAAGETTIRTATYWGMVGTDIVLANGDAIFLQGVTAFSPADVTWSGGGVLAPPPPAVGQLVTGGTGADELRGGAGNDTLDGGGGSDDLQGFDGDDRMVGGPAHDGMTLGGGRDTVAWTRGDDWDWVVDFTPGTDRIEISGLVASQVTQVATSYWGMAGRELRMPGGEGIFLQGVTGALGAGDLVFA
jgi:Ca2+-binding RTX toxin-like protein